MNIKTFAVFNIAGKPRRVSRHCQTRKEAMEMMAAYRALKVAIDRDPGERKRRVPTAYKVLECNSGAVELRKVMEAEAKPDVGKPTLDDIRERTALRTGQYDARDGLDTLEAHRYNVRKLEILGKIFTGMKQS